MPFCRRIFNVNKYLLTFRFAIIFMLIKISESRMISFSMIHFIDNQTLAYYNLTHPDETE